MVPRSELLTVLTQCVRVMSVSQVARIWWNDTRWGHQRAKKYLRLRESQGLLHCKRVLARPVGSLKSPLIVWRENDDEPDWTAISKQLHRRTQLDPLLISIALASRLSFDVFSDWRMTPVKLTQMTHDLQVSEVFLRYRKHGLPIESWISEDRLPASFPAKVKPDALLVDSEGTWQRAVEYGGDYSVSRLLALRTCAANCKITFELW